MPSVCVVGAGVVGLTTATLLQEARPGVRVTLFADKFEEDTTSVGAAGLFTPGAMFRGPSEDVTWRWLAEGFAYYKRLLQSPEADEAGVVELSGYKLSVNDPGHVRTPIESLTEFRLLTPQETRTFNGDWKYGSFVKTLLVENQRHLPYLLKKFRRNGGQVVKRHVTSLEELADEFDVVCNCSGLGARVLCGDRDVVPVRGQIFQVKAPWVKKFCFTDQDAYIIPGIDHVTVGGTRQFDNSKLEVDKFDSRAIWEKCTSLMPSLKDAKVIREWVGLRPHRHVVRVESEVITSKRGKPTHVVHNYGHGAYGVMGAPGTAMHAVRLALEALDAGTKAKL
ncbi:D-aspartate oxidase-like [Penaeus japonicus]|uniref:D-aspartate oxidase-like n=1 Tax=Penaeus japonicus TaxID=27405 RepID=UPI001C70C814|nr:D-aspartate oxidase-like [Penaeus japonicus]